MDKSKSDEAICKKDEFDKEKTAVALSYNPADAAPKVIASGKGFVAERIIQRAMETDIPIHKDEQLAHSLSKLEIGEMIPPQLYDVVAEVLVFVDKMDRIRQKVNAHEQ
ncbi:MAG: flagellar biosynthesis protein FlhB [Clostridiales bacterium]|nr:flagellar biosynthesis protein FlhB [Clostridiales bacterium]